MIKNILKKIADRMGYLVLKKGLPADIMREGEFLTILKTCQPYTMVPADRSFALYKAIEYLSRNKIEGDIVECGVWKGGQSMLAALTLIKEKDAERNIALYDTYAGMSEPTEYDRYAFNDSPGFAFHKWKQDDKSDHNDWCYASLEEVRENVFSTGYSKEKFTFIKGKVEETIPARLPEKIALLRLDTDWYESTQHELRHLYPRLVTGGVLLIDDYDSWEGARKAVDEYIAQEKASILLIKIGQGRIGVKVG